MLKEAAFSEKVSEETQACLLCPHYCSILPSRRGICGVRINRGEKIYSETYGKITFCEKKKIEEIPIYHFRPDSNVLLVGSLGCNMRCPFCNTFKLSQMGGAKSEHFSPAELVQKAKENETSGIIFSINEPLLNYEYILDVAIECKSEKLFIGLGTNAFFNRKVMKEITPLIDVFLVGLKSFDEDYLLRKCGGKTSDIQFNIEKMFEANVHVEISYLLIPDETDKPNQIESLVNWISKSKHTTPLHLLRYEAAYQYNIPPISMKKIIPIYEKAKNILPYVYVSNLNNRKMNQTLCPRCKTVIIDREDSKIISTRYNQSNECLNCGIKIDIS